MSHAFAMVPNFAVPLSALPEPERATFHADPILVAIDAHQEAWAVFQAAPEGDAAGRAEDAEHAALAALLGTACTTRTGAFCLLRHLRWFLDEEASNAGAYGNDWHVAQAREADLTLLLGCDGIRRIPVALPLGRLASVPVEPVPPSPMRAPLVIETGPARSPALIRLTRAASAVAERITALILIAGGGLLTGLASLV